MIKEISKGVGASSRLTSLNVRAEFEACLWA